MPRRLFPFLFFAELLLTAASGVLLFPQVVVDDVMFRAVLHARAAAQIDRSESMLKVPRLFTTTTRLSCRLGL